MVFAVTGLVVACGAEVTQTPTDPAPAGDSTNGSTLSSSTGGVVNGGNTNGGGGVSFCAADVKSCAPARHLASPSALVAEAAKLSWQGVSLSKSSALTIGDDLVADVDLDVDAAALTAPPDCTTKTSCHAPLFRDYAFPAWSGPGVDGVTCAVKGDRPVRKGDTCARVTIAKGTTFRLRAVVEDMHPSGPTYWPFVEFAKSCETPCGVDETRCSATQTCFAIGYASCAFCEGETAQTCSCREGCGTKPNGVECSFDTSPDYVVTGVCRSGSCDKN